MIIVVSLLLLLVLLTAWMLRRRVLVAAGKALVVDDDPRVFDAIVVLNGNISTRPYRAAELYKRNPSPVLMARLADTEEVRLGVIPNVSDATRDLLVKLGVAGDDITVLSSERWIAGTWAEALLLCGPVRSRGYRTVAIVTDAFHTRRARWTFRRIMGDDRVDFRCAATCYSAGLLNRWWHSEYGVIQLVIEYLKFAYYRRTYGTGGRGPWQASDLPAAGEARRLVSGADAKDRSASDGSR